jgi:hypothetical protein
MRFVANTDAMIFDMRRNGGGNPEMVRFICSYLFKEPTHLNTLCWRENDRRVEFWTITDLPGPSLADVPAFVLTSGYTFSGAEEFTYDLKTRRRATIVGETTGGGANPGGTFPLNDRFNAFIPTGRAVNPVTGTSWEGVGVEPDVACAADAALDTALGLAREAAEAHRRAREQEADALWGRLDEQLEAARRLDDKGRSAAAATILAEGVREALANGMLGEMDVNQLGYELLVEGRTAVAIAVFTVNAETYPDSSNVYDSLAEGYMKDGQLDRAIELYERSLELDPANGNATVMIERIRARQAETPSGR